MTVEIDEDLFNVVAEVAGSATFRFVVEEGLKLWLASHGVPTGAEQILANQAQASPPVSSDTTKGR
jgi:hypothetical protein